MSDQHYCYPPTFGVLKNLANIQDAKDLERFETWQVSNRRRTCPTDIALTYEGYKAIHKHLFQDVYAWAGQPRTVDIGKGNLFCRPQHIEAQMQHRFKLIASDKGLQKHSKEVFCNRAAEHVCELNAIHPFREGNGRTQRQFLECLAHHYGYQLNTKNIDKDLWMQASIKSFKTGDSTLMAQCVSEATKQVPRHHSVIRSRTNDKERER